MWKCYPSESGTGSWCFYSCATFAAPRSAVLAAPSQAGWTALVRPRLYLMHEAQEPTRNHLCEDAANPLQGAIRGAPCAVGTFSKQESNSSRMG